MIWLVDVVLFVIAGALTVVLARLPREHRRAARAQARALIAQAGFTASGNLLATFEVRGVSDGVDVEVTNRTLRIPPGRPELEQRSVCVVGVAVALADQITCKAAEADQVMGPLSAVPRVRTGHEAFDDAYAVFVGAAGGTNSASYRTSPDRTETPWAQPPVLDGLSDLELLWMRVQNGHVEIVFPPLEVEDVVRAAVLAAAFTRASLGKTVLAPARGDRRLVRSYYDPEPDVAWFAGLIVTVSGLSAGFVSPIISLDHELCCGAGDRMIFVPAGDGMSLQCEQHPDNSLLLHFVGSALFLGLTFVVVWLGVVGWRAWRARTRPVEVR